VALRCVPTIPALLAIATGKSIADCSPACVLLGKHAAVPDVLIVGAGPAGNQRFRSGKIQVLFNSMPMEFRPATVVLDVAGSRREVANDYAWIFAGGTPPLDLLRKIGVQLGDRDL
jgi:hypothetical protein